MKEEHKEKIALHEEASVLNSHTHQWYYAQANFSPSSPPPADLLPFCISAHLPSSSHFLLQPSTPIFCSFYTPTLRPRVSEDKEHLKAWINTSHSKLCSYELVILTPWDSVSSVVGRKHDPYLSVVRWWGQGAGYFYSIYGSGNVFPSQNHILKEEPRILGMSYPLSGAHPAYPQPSIVGKEGGQFL